MYPHASRPSPQPRVAERPRGEQTRGSYRAEVHISGPAFGTLEIIITGDARHPPSTTVPSSYSSSSFTAPLAAYVDHETGEPIAVRGKTLAERNHAIKLAQAYWRDVKSIEESNLGEAIRRRTSAHTPLEIIASGVDEHEERMPGTMQTTTFLSNGSGFYTRDATNYNAKLAKIGELHAETPELIHQWITIHEYVHGRGVRSERENHETVYASLRDELERTHDPRKRREYERLLNVQARELELRYGVKKKAKKPSPRVLN